ncbi:MAG TPA: hypothetical protein VMR33_18405 [Candidatus Baltobacteraceae bacterium]|jgi:hypothetical protein|nr:hypothetical protein [Candidatus Baltobacteraceae bacterium]
MKNQPSKTEKGLNNHEIVTLAVYLLGGETQYVDTEDVAVKANEIAPGRFTWRKYSSQINIENVRTFLSDAKKQKNGGYLRGAGKDGWLLTESGFAFAERRVTNLEKVDLSRERISAKDRKWLQHERERMLGSDAFRKYSAGTGDTITIQEADIFFRLDVYVTGKAREDKIVRALNAFGSDPELGEAVKNLAARARTREEIL